MAQWQTVRIASRLDAMGEVEAKVLARIRESGLEEQRIFALRLAIEEAVANAVKHGNKMDPDKRVTVRFELNGPEFLIFVEDQGEGFDPAKLPDPLAEENLLRANGRGIFFMKNFMDEVVYNFPADRGTQVKMVKKLPDRDASV